MLNAHMRTLNVMGTRSYSFNPPERPAEAESIRWMRQVSGASDGRWLSVAVPRFDGQGSSRS